MNKIIVCVLVIGLMLSILFNFYNVCFKHAFTKDKSKLSENYNSCHVGEITTKIFQENTSFTDSISDEDVKYLQDKGWNVHQVKNWKSVRNKRSIASIANCVWRVLNYPYMYNFYPILNFGVSKIMTGIGELINNVHFPLFSSSMSTTSQQPMSDSEQQAQQLAYAQGQALSQEYSSTISQDINGDTGYNPPPVTNHMGTPSQEYQDSKDDEDKEKEEEEEEKQEDIKQKLRLEEVNKKIDEKAAILAKKYVQMYFSQKQQEQDNSNNLRDTNVELPSLEGELLTPTTDQYDFNTVNNYAIPNVNNLPAYN